MFSSQEKAWYPYTVALTFDDGPHPFYTRELLKICNYYNVKATFFLVGKQVKKHRDLVESIYKNGHEIGNHTFNHVNMTKIPVNKIADELKKNSELIKQVNGTGTKVFRPPGGNYNDQVMRTAGFLGHRIALWDVLPNDLHQQSSEKLLHTILRKTSDGDIVLLHSGVDRTLACLPHLIEQLRIRGFRFVTASESLSLKDNKKTAQY